VHKDEGYTSKRGSQNNMPCDEDGKQHASTEPLEMKSLVLLEEKLTPQ
jgi:hypothetical protein